MGVVLSMLNGVKIAVPVGVCVVAWFWYRAKLE